MNNLLNGTDWEDRPAIFSFGISESKESCAEKCGKEPMCYVYSWFTTGDEWDKRCYGRGFGAPENLRPIYNDSATCGLKLC